MGTSPQQMSGRTWIDLILLAVVWGLSFLAMRLALDEIGPLTIALHRVGWAALVLWLVLGLRGIALPRDPKAWAAFAVMGALNNVIPFSLIAWGQLTIETGLAAILNASTALWGVTVAALLLPQERLTRRRAIGVVLGFAGVATAIGLQSLATLDLRSLSQLAILVAGLSYAFASVWARLRLASLPPEAAATGMLTCSTLILLPLAWAVEGRPTLDMTARSWIGIGYVSIFATAIAYLLYYRLIRAAGSGNTMLVTLLLIPVGIVAGAVVLGETLGAGAFAGFGLIALGLAVLDGRLMAKKRLAPEAPGG